MCVGVGVDVWEGVGGLVYLLFVVLFVEGGSGGFGLVHFCFS